MYPTDLIRHINDEYHISPEYLFAKSPDTAIFRHDGGKKQGKWFCVLMTIHADKLGLSGDNYHNIINVKVRPEFTGSLLAMNGILPAYHMNKEHWVSVLMDVAGDDEVKQFIDESFELTL